MYSYFININNQVISLANATHGNVYKRKQISGFPGVFCISWFSESPFGKKKTNAFFCLFVLMQLAPLGALTWMSQTLAVKADWSDLVRDANFLLQPLSLGRTFGSPSTSLFFYQNVTYTFQVFSLSSCLCTVYKKSCF